MPFSPLDLNPTDDADRAGRPLWVIAQPFTWTARGCGYFCEVTVPVGYATNFASTPRLFWRVFPPDHPRWRKATIIHDWLCDAPDVPRRVADAVFFECLVDLRASLATRWLMWFGVRAFAMLSGKG